MDIFRRLAFQLVLLVCILLPVIVSEEFKHDINPLDEMEDDRIDINYLDELEKNFLSDLDIPGENVRPERQDEDPPEAEEAPSLPVQQDHYCKEQPFFKDLELAKKNILFGVTLFHFNEYNPNTLHIVLRPEDDNFKYDYLMAMMVDDRGMPAGHFHMLSCDKNKPAFRDGIWMLGVHCTTLKWSEKWGNTEYMFLEKDPTTNKRMGKHSLFWSWIPDDGPKPKKLQLRFGFIQDNKLWVKFHSSVIEFREKWPYHLPNDEGFPEPGDDDPNACFKDIVSQTSQGNFILSKDQQFLESNQEFLIELNSWFNESFRTTEQSMTNVTEPPVFKSKPKVAKPETGNKTIKTSQDKVKEEKSVKGLNMSLPITDIQQKSNNESAKEGIQAKVKDKPSERNKSNPQGTPLETKLKADDPKKKVDKPEAKKKPKGPPSDKKPNTNKTSGTTVTEDPSIDLKPNTNTTSGTNATDEHETKKKTDKEAYNKTTKPESRKNDTELEAYETTTEGDIKPVTEENYNYESEMDEFDDDEDSTKKLVEEAAAKKQVTLRLNSTTGRPHLHVHDAHEGDGPNKETEINLTLPSSTIRPISTATNNVPSRFSTLALCEYLKGKEQVQCMCKDKTATELRTCKCQRLKGKAKKICLCRGLEGNILVSCICQSWKGVERQLCIDHITKKQQDRILNLQREKPTGNPGKKPQDLEEEVKLNAKLNSLKDKLEKLHKKRHTKAAGRSSYAQEPMHPPLINVPIKNPVKGLTMYTGCGIQKGCTGDIPKCVARENCNFLITYMAFFDGPKRNYLRFEMHLKIPEGFGYGAVGISRDKKMGEDSVVECSVDKLGTPGVYASWNDGKSNQRVGGDCSDIRRAKEQLKSDRHDYVKDCNIARSKGFLTCSFYHKKSIKVPLENGSSIIFDIKDEPYFLLNAYGKTVEQVDQRNPFRRIRRDVGNESTLAPRKGKIGKHTKVGSSSHSLDLSSSEEVPDLFAPLLVWHGNFMLLSCLVLAPTGMFVARYFKEAWSTTVFCNMPVWLIVHFTYMLWAFMFMLMGIVFGKAHSAAIKRKFVEDEENHSTAGWFAFALFSIQFLAGNWLPYAPKDIRIIFRLIHWALGFVANYFCLIIAMVSAIMASSQFPYFSSAIIVGWVVYSLFIHLCMTFVCHTGDREVLSLHNDGFMVYYRALLPLPIPPIHVKPSGSTLRLILFLWYQFGACAAFIPIFITSSEGQGRYDCSTWSLLQFKCDSFKSH